jgi:hypothetical protein
MVSKYLGVLRRLHILQEEIPVTASSKFKKRLYSISEPYFNFWFRYIYPNRIDLEANRNEEVLGMIKKDFPLYCGQMFEMLVKELILQKYLLGEFSFSRIGRWWHKDKEIDIIGLNEETNEIVFVECEWKDVSYEGAEHILSDLEDKTSFVRWNNETRKEHFGIVAKKVEGKEKLRQCEYLVFDLDDID